MFIFLCALGALTRAPLQSDEAFSPAGEEGQIGNIEMSTMPLACLVHRFAFRLYRSFTVVKHPSPQLQD
jgi:hypothetical protein